MEKKESILYKKLNLAFVYIFIFLIGMLIVFFMTSYLNNKVKEFNNEIVTNTNKWFTHICFFLLKYIYKIIKKGYNCGEMLHKVVKSGW